MDPEGPRERVVQDVEVTIDHTAEFLEWFLREVPIEERSAREVTHVGTAQLAPTGAAVWNPAFDVTPNALVAGIITERGVARPPYGESLKRLFEVEPAHAGALDPAMSPKPERR